jgi:ATP-binding cassette subfamily B protein
MINRGFPFIHQLYATDCGFACLKMIGKYYGVEIPYSRLNHLRINSDGISLTSLLADADELGFNASPIYSTFEKIRKKDIFPAIAFVNSNHFVVIINVSEHFIHIADPANGIVRYEKSEFLQIWLNRQSSTEGLLVLLQPTDKLYDSVNAPSKEAKISFAKHLQPFKLQLFLLVVGLIIGSLIELVLPFLSKTIYDKGIGLNNVNIIYLICIFQILLIISKVSVEFVRAWIYIYVSTKLSVEIISDFLKKLISLPLPFFTSKNIGDISQRIQDHQRVEKFMTETLLNTVFAFFTFIALNGFLFYLSHIAFLIFIIGSTIEIIWINYFYKGLTVLDKKNFTLLAEDQNKIFEIVQGMQEIKLNTLGLAKAAEWQQTQQKIFRLNINKLKYTQIYDVYRLVNGLYNILITGICSANVIYKEMTIGSLFAIAFILGQLNGPVSQLINAFLQWQYAKLSLVRLNEIQLQKSEKINANFDSSSILGHPIKVRNLSFRYYTSKKSDYVLKNLSFHLLPGKTTAIVGQSGSGKTTILKLLLNLYTDYEGSIQIGSQDISQLSYDQWRNLCGAVLQDSFIFSETIAYNICLSYEVCKERMLYAIKLANLSEFVDSQILKEQTKIGENGWAISAGQRQRILIARVIYKNPHFVFFDEATNALDTTNEVVIMNNLKDFIRDKTVVIVAHRLSTIIKAHQILVVDDGRIVEQGNHNNLLAKKGTYYNLIKNQLKLEGHFEDN